MTRRVGTIAGGVAGAIGCAAAAVLAGVAAIAVVAVGALVIASQALEGCEVGSGDLEGPDLALTRNVDGSIQARTQACGGSAAVQTVLLRRVGGPVVWSAHREGGTASLAAVTVGRAPDGFVEDVPLARFQDGVGYEVVFSPLDLTGVPTSSPDVATLFAGTGRFRPEQVHVSRYWLGGRELTADQFAREACR